MVFVRGPMLATTYYTLLGNVAGEGRDNDRGEKELGDVSGTTNQECQWNSVLLGVL